MRFKIMGLLFLAVDVLLIWKFSSEAVLRLRMRRRGVRTVGTVIDHVRNDGAVSQPVIEFIDRQGRTKGCTPDPVIREFRPVGDRIPIVYLPEQPAQARIADSDPRLVATAAMVAFAVACCSFGGVACLLS